MYDMSDLIKALGGVESAKSYLEWMEKEGLIMGSYPISNGRLLSMTSLYEKLLNNVKRRN